MNLIVAMWLACPLLLLPALIRLVRLDRRARKMRERFVRCLPAIENAAWRHSLHHKQRYEIHEDRGDW